MTQKRVLFVHSFKDFSSLFLNLLLKKFFRFSLMVALKCSTIRLRRSIENPLVNAILLIFSIFVLAVFYLNSKYLAKHIQWNSSNNICELKICFQQVFHGGRQKLDFSVAFVKSILISNRKDRLNSYLERSFLLIMKFSQGKLFHTLKFANWACRKL